MSWVPPPFLPSTPGWSRGGRGPAWCCPSVPPVPSRPSYSRPCCLSLAGRAARPVSSSSSVLTAGVLTLTRGAGMLGAASAGVGRMNPLHLTMWRALAARRGRLPEIDWRSSLQAQHLNSVQAVNTARQADDVPPWQRQPRLAAVLTPSGREYEMLWTEG